MEPGKAVRGMETILLVEDDERVRSLIHEVLVGYGHQILEAANGPAAISVCESYTETIHLLVTDVVMPGISGRALVSRLTQLHPEMKVLYMSGYTHDVIVDRAVLEQGTHFLQKPFELGVLARKVREVLDAPGEC
jgi:two-component system cell cycle sensor histidine kinase/response regulator CckA